MTVDRLSLDALGVQVLRGPARVSSQVEWDATDPLPSLRSRAIDVSDEAWPAGSVVLRATHSGLRVGVAETALPAVPRATALVASDPDRFDGRFIAHVLRADGLRAESVGLANPRLDPRVLLLKRVPVPDLETQRRARGSLDAALEVYRRKRAALRQVEHLVASTFFSIYPGVPAPGDQHATLADLVELVRPQRHDARAAIRGRNVAGGPFCSPSASGPDLAEREISRESARLRRLLWIEPGDVLLSVVTHPDRAGYATLWRETATLADAQSVIALRPRTDVLPEFVWLQLNATRLESLRSSSSLAGAARMSRRGLLRRPVWAPSCELQTRSRVPVRLLHDLEALNREMRADALAILDHLASAYANMGDDLQQTRVLQTENLVGTSPDVFGGDT